MNEIHRQATVELGEARITVRHGDKRLDLERNGAEIPLAARGWARGTDGAGGDEKIKVVRSHGLFP